MQRILEYHRYAEECRKLAELLINPRHKQKLKEMAAAWDTCWLWSASWNWMRRILVLAADYERACCDLW
jgi:hypothetical protein